MILRVTSLSMALPDSFAAVARLESVWLVISARKAAMARGFSDGDDCGWVIDDDIDEEENVVGGGVVYSRGRKYAAHP